MKDKITEGILNFAMVLQTNRFMSAIKNAFTALLPIIIGGAFCTLILNVGLSTTTTGLSLAKLPGMAWLSGLTPMFNAANYATMNFFAIGLVVLASIELAKHHGRDEIIVPAVALASYIALCATTVVITAESGEVINVANVLASKFTNAQGLFMGMFSSLISTELYCKIVNGGKFEIKMPDSVPSNVVRAFNVLFPSIITILTMAAFGQLFNVITGYTVFDAIAVFIQTPLQGLLTGLPGYLLIFFISTLLWSFGIHGTQVIKPVYEATLLIALAENAENALAGLPATNILNTSFLNVFTISTGAGITFGLIVSILLFSKKPEHRAIAKLSVAPGIFNINETVTFGLPVVLNPVFAIPFMLAPIVSATIGYFLTKIGFATIMLYNVPWTTPPLLSAFLATGGHIGTVIAQAIAIASSILVYAPFVLMANKQRDTEVESLEIN